MDEISAKEETSMDVCQGPTKVHVKNEVASDDASFEDDSVPVPPFEEVVVKDEKVDLWNEETGGDGFGQESLPKTQSGLPTVSVLDVTVKKESSMDGTRNKPSTVSNDLVSGASIKEERINGKFSEEPYPSDDHTSMEEESFGVTVKDEKLDPSEANDSISNGEAEETSKESKSNSDVTEKFTQSASLSAVSDHRDDLTTARSAGPETPRYPKRLTRKRSLKIPEDDPDFDPDEPGAHQEPGSSSSDEEESEDGNGAKAGFSPFSEEPSVRTVTPIVCSNDSQLPKTPHHTASLDEDVDMDSETSDFIDENCVHVGSSLLNKVLSARTDTATAYPDNSEPPKTADENSDNCDDDDEFHGSSVFLGYSPVMTRRELSFGSDAKESSDESLASLAADDLEHNVLYTISGDSGAIISEERGSPLSDEEEELVVLGENEDSLTEGTTETAEMPENTSEGIISPDSGVETSSASRKNSAERAARPDQWKKNKAKAALNRGQAHVTSTGKLKAAKKMKEGCHKNCKVCAKSGRLTEAQRQVIFNGFYDLGDPARRWDFIATNVGTAVPKKKFVEEDKGRSHTKTYSFEVTKNKRVRVCKQMFLATLAINGSVVNRALMKRTPDGSCLPDGRGKHDNRPQRTRRTTLDSVREHIEAFPKVDSYHTSERSQRQYLENGLSIEKMYRMYEEWAKVRGVQKPASKRTYKEIFKREYNFGFFAPKKDQCQTHNRYKFACVEKKKVLEEDFRQHYEDVEAAKKIKAAEREAEIQGGQTDGPKKCCSTFDLQKTFSCPRAETSAFYYKSKASVHNFTVFHMEKKEGHCYLWHECVGTKGANEIASNLYNYIRFKYREGYKEFVFFSDSAVGQDKIRFVFSMYKMASIKHNIKIKHIFLVPGHTYTELDAVHNCIERLVRHREVFTFDQYAELIQDATQPGETLIVNKLVQDDIRDYKDLVVKQNWEQDTNRKNVEWSKMKMAEFDPAEPDLVRVWYTYKGEPVQLDVNQQKGRSVCLQIYSPPPAYNGPLPVKALKKTHLAWLMKKHIPIKYHDFYHQLLTGPTDPDDEDAGVRREVEEE